MIEYRNIQPEDAVLLRHLAESCPPLDVHTHYTYWVVANYFGMCGFIAEDNGMPIGYIMAVETKNCVFVWQIGIIESYRGKDISRDLIKRVHEVAKTKELPLEVSIADENIPSRSAFSNYCKHNKCQMERIGMVELSDDSFDEKEVFYKIFG